MRAQLTLESQAPTGARLEGGVPRNRLTWRMLAVVAGVGDLAMLAWLSLASQDRFALGLMVPIAIALGLLRFRGGTLGCIVLGMSMADMTWYTVSGAVWNAINGAGPAAVITPGWLGACSTAGLVAVIVSLVHRRSNPTTATLGPRLVGGAAVAGFALLVATSAVFAAPRANMPATSALEIASQNMAFSTKDLSADAGQVTVRLTNRDLSWHTFTIDSLGVDLKVPVNADGTVTFEAAPRTYEFYCSIPGHASMGMRGTLTIR